MENDASKYFINAAQKLNQASKELFKPEDDIVTYLVCKNSQYAIENYLKGYLLKNEVDTTEYETIENLYEQCKKLNKKFEKVSLVGFDCKAHNLDSRYCNEVTKINNCFDIADSLDTFLRKEKII
ncbi:HEPN domain-containing protein [Thalassobellus suaedae]|uniref:HEPN domain-containing protein n=1 Tax=Thalassobellus suaedae TaxID=3074124 RepID=A0ABY9XQW6_9FLAO|nr:HEPN domain-containing protein [Flavobacteriaceae bacterium HL-DH14]WNH13653.1 HEPN domain-containing protein [Flavobacteriaceae bacterium HL-DH10]